MDAQRFTAQEVFAAVAADPRVKAYPKLVGVLRSAILELNECDAMNDNIVARDINVLLRELGELK